MGGLGSMVVMHDMKFSRINKNVIKIKNVMLKKVGKCAL